jgi:hypothetical protein
MRNGGTIQHANRHRCIVNRIGKETNMKTKILAVSLLMLGLFTTACGVQPTVETSADEPAGELATPTTELPGTLDDLDSLMQTLRAAGATVEPGEAVEQAFFTVPGQIIKVNDGDVQVFVYDTAEAMEAEASQVAEDGGSIGTNMVMWVEAPHFYKLGQILVLYVGEDQAVIDLLEGIFGPQFAGR